MRKAAILSHNGGLGFGGQVNLTPRRETCWFVVDKYALVKARLLPMRRRVAMALFRLINQILEAADHAEDQGSRHASARRPPCKTHRIPRD